MARQKMAYMEAYNNGYVPPRGSAGKAAFGEYSTKKNPLSVPYKGSELPSGSQFGDNADRNKVQRLQREQAKNESLRGYSC